MFGRILKGNMGQAASADSKQLKEQIEPDTREGTGPIKLGPEHFNHFILLLYSL